MKRFTSLETLIDQHAHRLLAKLPDHGIWGALVEFLVFGLKQAWACLFGACMLGLILGTYLFYPTELWLSRYDFLFLAAFGLQAFMLTARLEKLSEAKVILIFHAVGTVMEIFKTSVGSWVYPESSIFRIAGVPLFSGFMYASVGSYLARVSRLFDLRYTHYPRFELTALLCIGIYVNFFAHHFIWDFRWVLFALTGVLFVRCTVHFRVFRFRHRMPLLLGFFLVSFFIWIAENIATFSKIWLYPQQVNGWKMVSPSKLAAWYLLMIISFVLVTIVHVPRRVEEFEENSNSALGVPVERLTPCKN